MTHHQPVEIALSPSQFVAVRTVLGANIGPLSPFNTLPVPSAQPAHPQELASTGFCDPAGNIHPYYARLVNVLAQPAGMVRVSFDTEVGEGPEVFAYFGAQGGRASLSNEGGLVKLRSPDDAPALLELLGQHFGDSVLKSCEFEAEVHPEVALVLAAAMDLQRRAFLQLLASGGQAEAAPIAMDPSHVAAHLGAMPATTQSLARVLAALLGRPAGAHPANIPSAMHWLLQAGMLQPAGTMTALASPVLLLSRRLLVIDRILSVMATRFAPHGGLDVTSFTCLQSGVHDLLMLETGGEAVRFKASSSSHVVSLATHLLAGGFLRPASAAA